MDLVVNWHSGFFGFIVLNVIDKMFLRSLINICLGFQGN